MTDLAEREVSVLQEQVGIFALARQHRKEVMVGVPQDEAVKGVEDFSRPLVIGDNGEAGVGVGRVEQAGCGRHLLGMTFRGTRNRPRKRTAVVAPKNTALCDRRQGGF